MRVYINIVIKALLSEKQLLRLFVLLEESLSCLTFKCILHHMFDAVSKFWFYIKKGSSKKFYERRAYESVDDGSLSLVMSRKAMEKIIHSFKGVCVCVYTHNYYIHTGEYHSKVAKKSISISLQGDSSSTQPPILFLREFSVPWEILLSLISFWNF